MSVHMHTYYSVNMWVIPLVMYLSYLCSQFFSFVGLFLFAGLASFMGVCVMLKWRNTQAKYAEKA